MDVSLLNIPTVTELTTEIKRILELEFADIMVEGEISQPKRSVSGHIYFTLKDANAQLPCVMWRSSAARLSAIPQHGDKIICAGQIQVYAPHGKYQMVVSDIRRSGEGELQAQFEKLKQKLLAEGLFDESIKKPLPRFPKRIGVITSRTSAAFQDIRDTMERRYPLATILLYHTATQGDNAAPELTEAVKFLDEHGNCDVIIIGRGGGSLEDLWPFNDEQLARAIHACRTPVISAVGHETDFSICDFVADLRASTPTQAAVLATPNKDDLLVALDDLQQRSKRYLSKKVGGFEQILSAMQSSYGLKRVPQKITHQLEWLGHNRTRMHDLLKRCFDRKQHRLLEVGSLLKVNSPNLPLEKGFSRIWQSSQWIRSSTQLDAKKPVEIEWKDGRVSKN